MTSKEARNKTYWLSITSKIREVIEIAINEGRTFTEAPLNAMNENVDVPSLKCLGYKVKKCYNNDKWVKISW